jgi:hypothetical protein
MAGYCGKIKVDKEGVAPGSKIILETQQDNPDLEIKNEDI